MIQPANMKRVCKLLTISCLALVMGCGEPTQEAPEEVEDNCSYPQTGDRLTDSDPMPRAAWAEAYRADGSTLRFSMNDVHQSVGEWCPFDVLVFVAVPTW